MAYLNEVDAATLASWLSNFDNCPNNIYKPYQDNPINFSRYAYDLLCQNNSNHVNIYFGIDDSNYLVLIAVGSYLLDNFDGEETSGYADILEPGKIIELYSNAPITKSQAIKYIDKWATQNSQSRLFKKSYLLPRPNFIKLFLEDQASIVRIFFGMEADELKVMQKNPGDGSGAVAFNRAFACPYDCPGQGLA